MAVVKVERSSAGTIVVPVAVGVVCVAQLRSGGVAGEGSRRSIKTGLGGAACLVCSTNGRGQPRGPAPGTLGPRRFRPLGERHIVTPLGEEMASTL